MGPRDPTVDVAGHEVVNHADKEAERSLERLGVDQVGLYLVYWPQDGPIWRGRGWSGR
jgi:diketogulonate reductase-like aldo/keto reductase